MRAGEGEDLADPPAGVAPALEGGWHATRVTLDRWNRSPGPVLFGWIGLSVLISCGLLVAVLLVASLVPADPSPSFVPGISDDGGMRDVAWIFSNNLVVLALHATACVAGFIAGASMPAVAATKRGISRSIHLNAGRIAIVAVVVITSFSLVTQAYALGLHGAGLAERLDLPIGVLVISVLPHALPELTALFLPLAAWIIASRKEEWNQLLAATLITVTIAVPVLAVTAAVEVELWPRLLEQLSPVI